MHAPVLPPADVVYEIVSDVIGSIMCSPFPEVLSTSQAQFSQQICEKQMAFHSSTM